MCQKHKYLISYTTLGTSSLLLTVYVCHAKAAVLITTRFYE